MSLTVLNHPLAEHLMAGLRNKDTAPEHFRHCARRITTLLAIEATREMKVAHCSVETPLESMQGKDFAQGLSVVPVLRAGLAMLEPIVELFPDVSVGYIGLERNHATAVAHSYYVKLPKLAGRYTLCVDPMLATGGSASQAISMLKAGNPAAIVMVSVVAAPDGVAKLEHDHPDVPIVVAAVDRGLNDKKYILPGLGDFGDRLYGTI
jgi:uracil phosphoribosyltransferase